MKRIILILGLAVSMGLTGTGSVHAQFVVHDPGHTLLNSTEWIANVKKWVTQINEMIDAQELRLGLQKIDQLKELKSLKELADLLDDVACLSSDYSFYLNVGSNYHCLKFLNFQLCNRQPEPEYRSAVQGSHRDQLLLDELGRPHVLYRAGKGIGGKSRRRDA